MIFNDLVFRQHPYLKGGVQATHFFSNGYGVSVIKTPYSYGGNTGCYELAVLQGDIEGYTITYKTKVTKDVEGYLTEENVTELIEKIEKLGKTKQAKKLNVLTTLGKKRK